MCVRAYHCMCAWAHHLLQKYGCIGFEVGSSTGSSPAWCKMWWESKEKESNRYLPKIAMLFGVAPSAKNSDFTARLRHLLSLFIYFPTCQVRVVRFYLSCLLLLLLLSSSSRRPPPLVVLLLSLSSSSRCPPRPPAQLRLAIHSVRCRTSTTTIHAQCSLPDLNHGPSTPQWSLPDLNHGHPRPVFPAGPQPRPSPPSVPCRTSTTTIHAQFSLPDLNHDHPRPVFPAGPHEICQIECQKICQMEC